MNQINQQPLKVILKGDLRMVYFAYAMAWVATAVASCYGMKVTGSAWCLWALLLPACLGIN